MPHHRQSSVCEGQLLESLAATLVPQLHAVVQQFLFLSQARVHVGRKCVGREEVCVRERDRVRVCGRKLAALSLPRVLSAGTRRCKCDVSTNKCCKKHDSSETLPHLTHFDSLLQEHGLSSIDLSSSLLLALFFISYSAQRLPLSASAAIASREITDHHFL